jgi:hypothetical protein
MLLVWKLQEEKSPWVSAYDALPAYLRGGEERSSSANVVVLKLVLFRRAGSEWAGVVQLFTVVGSGFGQRAAFFPGQGVDWFDVVHGSGWLICRWLLGFTSNLCGRLSAHKRPVHLVVQVFKGNSSGRTHLAAFFRRHAAGF